VSAGERWFELFKVALTGAAGAEGQTVDLVRYATKTADLGMVEVEKRGADATHLSQLRTVTAALVERYEALPADKQDKAVTSMIKSLAILARLAQSESGQ
jgi:hypothetical protein